MSKIRDALMVLADALADMIEGKMQSPVVIAYPATVADPQDANPAPKAEPVKTEPKKETPKGPDPAKASNDALSPEMKAAITALQTLCKTKGRQAGIDLLASEPFGVKKLSELKTELLTAFAEAAAKAGA